MRKVHHLTHTINSPDALTRVDVWLTAEENIDPEKPTEQVYGGTERGDAGTTTWTVELTKMPVSTSWLLEGLGCHMKYGANSPLYLTEHDILSLSPSSTKSGDCEILTARSVQNNVYCIMSIISDSLLKYCNDCITTACNAVKSINQSINFYFRHCHSKNTLGSQRSTH